MKAGGYRAWVSGIHNRWVEAYPPCGERDCTPMRRVWRRLGWWNGSIRLRDLSYCTSKCFEIAACEYFAEACTPTAVSSFRHRVPLGLLMLSRGELTHQQLQTALQAQQCNRHQRIGLWLERLGFATELQITTALGLQWACPVLAWKSPPDSGCRRLLPFRLLERFRMLPVQFVSSTRIFYVAFSEGIDYTALYAIEQMLDCRTHACLISRSSMDGELERMGHEARGGDLLFESWHQPAAMAHITCSYALKLGAEEVRIVGCGDYIWVRLECARDFATLLFRRPTGDAVPNLLPHAENDSFTCRVTG
jgi:hypothetical protein